MPKFKKKNFFFRLFDLTIQLRMTEFQNMKRFWTFLIRAKMTCERGWCTQKQNVLITKTITM